MSDYIKMMIVSFVFVTLLSACGVATPNVQPTPTPLPPIELTITPPQTVNCSGSTACQVSLAGTSINVANNADLRTYVLVFPNNPPGAGWYPQFPPAVINKDGAWTQNIWLGDDKNPPQSGHKFKIVVLAIHEDAKQPTTKPVSAYQDFDYAGVSDVIDLVVQ